MSAKALAGKHAVDLIDYAVRSAQMIGKNVSVSGSTLDITGGTAGSFALSVTNPDASNTSDGINVTAGTNGGSGALLMQFSRPDGTQIGNVAQASATTVAYNTTSDARLKDHVGLFQDGFSLVKRIQVRRYTFKSDPHKRVQVGFYAQELSEIWPDAVTPGGDDPTKNPWSVDYGKLTPLLVQTCQELILKIEAIKGRLVRLEDRVATK